MVHFADHTGFFSSHAHTRENWLHGTATHHYEAEPMRVRELSITICTWLQLIFVGGPIRKGMCDILFLCSYFSARPCLPCSVHALQSRLRDLFRKDLHLWVQHTEDAKQEILTMEEMPGFLSRELRHYQFMSITLGLAMTLLILKKKKKNFKTHNSTNTSTATVISKHWLKSPANVGLDFRAMSLENNVSLTKCQH